MTPRQHLITITDLQIIRRSAVLISSLENYCLLVCTLLSRCPERYFLLVNLLPRLRWTNGV